MPPGSGRSRSLVATSSCGRAGQRCRVDYVALIEACLIVLRSRAGWLEQAAVHRPVAAGFWRVSDAMMQIRTTLAEQPEGGDLIAFVPEMRPVRWTDRSRQGLRWRARSWQGWSLHATVRSQSSGGATLQMCGLPMHLAAMATLLSGNSRTTLPTNDTAEVLTAGHDGKVFEILRYAPHLGRSAPSAMCSEADASK